MVCAEVRAGGRTSSLSENMNDKGYDLETYSQSSSLLLLVNLLLVLTTCKVFPKARRIEPLVFPKARRIGRGSLPDEDFPDGESSRFVYAP